MEAATQARERKEEEREVSESKKCQEIADAETVYSEATRARSRKPKHSSREAREDCDDEGRILGDCGNRLLPATLERWEDI